MTDARPDPETLLAEIQGAKRPSGRGRFKIYLGMAAGVGKTYSMLADGKEAKRRGTDVLLGYLEPHGRSETELMADGLERIPPLRFDHRGVELREFDIDAAIRRKPELILVDELAHTNAPGSRHRKRWQDVEELLAAGIDVATTVNIQHVESLRDVVAQITGVFVQETVPDALVNTADQIELVDIPPEELIQRLHEGKIYVPEKVETALEGFFRKANLFALRELALRHTTEHVDEQMRGFRAAVTEPWHTVERLVVCIAPNKLANRVVRAAARMANSLHAEWIALYVDSPRQAAAIATGLDYATDAIKLAESLGAETVTLSGEDIVDEVLRFTRRRNATTIVVGKPIRKRWRELLFGSFVDTLVRTSGDVNVFVVTGAGDTGTVQRIAGRPEQGNVRSYVSTCIVVGLCTALCFAIHPFFALTNLTMVYLLGVTAVSARYGQREGILASLLSVILFDFFFVPPSGTLAVSDVQYAFTFAVMLVVSLLISTLTVRLRFQSKSASERERRTAALYDLSRRLAATRGRMELGKATVDKVRELLDCDACVLLYDYDRRELQPMPPSLTGFERLTNESTVAKWVAEHQSRAGQGTDTLTGAAASYFPMIAENEAVGVLGVVLDEERLQDPGAMHLLETFASQLAMAVQRANLAKQSHVSSLQAESERLRNSLLSAVSHDLRTPLAVIEGSAESLLASAQSERDKGLSEAIRSEAKRLGRLVRNLLDMTRVESGAVELNRDWQSLEELVGAAIGRTESFLAEHPIHVDLPDDLPLVRVDGLLLEQLLVNLLENAARHTPTGTKVTISALREATAAKLIVANSGPPIPEDDLDRIFRRFQGTKDGQGFGLGLAICRAIAEAHGGSIIARNVSKGSSDLLPSPSGGGSAPQAPGRGSGVEFVLTLPLDVTQPEVPVE